MNLRNVNLDQRQDFRKVPDKFAFLQLEEDDGGTVLDVSEGGLRFETFAPVQQNGPIHFWFSLNLRERIEAWGEVVWTSATKKCGGLRFLRLSEEGRALVRECISQPSVQEAPNGGFSRWGTAKEMPAKMGVREADAIARFVSKAPPRQEAAAVGQAIPPAWETPAENPPPRAPLPNSFGTADAVARFVSKAPPRQEAAAVGHAIPRAWEPPAENPPPRAPFPNLSGTTDAVARLMSKTDPRQEAAPVGHAIPRAWEPPAENPPPRGPLPNSFGTADAVARFVSKAPPRQEAAAVGHAVPRAWETTAAQNPPPRAPLPSFSGTVDAGDTNILFPPPKEIEVGKGLVPVQRYRSAKRRQLRLGLILGVCISATVAAAAMKYSRHENRVVPSAPAELPVQKSSADTLKPAPMNPSPRSGSSADIFASSNQKTHVAEARTPIVPPTNTGAHSSPRVREAGAANLPARASLQPNLSTNATRQNLAMPPKQLWAAVQAGNTKAAVELADLYIKGQGVPQNCNQARVLLLVASEKRNAEAIKKLAELDKTACTSN